MLGSGRAWVSLTFSTVAGTRVLMKSPLNVRLDASMKSATVWWLPIAFALILLSVAPTAGAQNLYTGKVPVKDQSAAQLERGMAAALRQVVQKLSGLHQFDDDPALVDALGQARSMVSSFSYSNRARLMPNGERQDDLHLVVEFDSGAVDQLVAALQLPLWKVERRALAIWLLVDDELGRRVMPVELEYAWLQMGRVAEDRGMPYTWPQPDSEGVYAVDTQLLWGGYTDELAADGPADALVVAARREGPEWHIRMNLGYGDQAWSWRSRSVELQDALVEGMNRAINELVAVQSIAAADRGSWQHDLTVTGLNRGGDYARCLAYLQRLSMVKQVSVRSATAGRVVFSLSLTTLPDYLVATFQSDGLLTTTAVEGVYVLAP